MRRIRTWQLCRTGVHGSDGATITEQDLNEILETFSPPRPISLGHDMAQGDSFPKFGDVLALDGIYPDPKRPGEKVLVGKVRLHSALDEQFDDGDGEGTYNGWSVTIPRRVSDGKRYLHSVAVLGATPPKIPGLDQLKIKTVYSEDLNTLIKRDFDSDYDIRENLPQTKGSEAKNNTAPMQRGLLIDEKNNNIGVITKGLTQYEIYKNNLYIPILRSTGIISNPQNPARTTPAGPPIETYDSQLITRNTAEFYVFYGSENTFYKVLILLYQFLPFFQSSMHPSLSHVLHLEIRS